MESDIESTTGSVDMLMQAIGKLAHKPSFRAPTFNGEGEVELFLEQFADVAEANEWSERHTLLHLRSCLEGSAKQYGRSDTCGEIFEALRSRYGTSARQAKECLRNLKRDSKESVRDLGNEIERLVNLAHPTMPQRERNSLAVDYLVQMESKSLQRHLLTVGKDTMAGTILAMEEYLAVGKTDQPACRTAVEHSGQADLAPIAELLKAQTELLSKMMLQMEVLERASKRNAPTVHRYSEVAARSPPMYASAPGTEARHTPPRVPSAGCYVCGGPHFKRECPVRTPGRNLPTTQRGSGNGGRPTLHY